MLLFIALFRGIALIFTEFEQFVNFLYELYVSGGVC